VDHGNIQRLDDGNCGFRTISLFIYNTDDKWRIIRDELTTWAKEHKEFVIDTFGIEGDIGFESMINSLKVPKGRRFVQQSQWFTFPEHGFITSAVHERPVVIIVKDNPLESATIIPLIMPNENAEPITLVLSHQHWSAVLFRGLAYPPIYPQCLAISPFFHEWEMFLQPFTDQWRVHVHTHEATSVDYVVLEE
jgi:hypothetical protein